VPVKAKLKEQIWLLRSL